MNAVSFICITTAILIAIGSVVIFSAGACPCTEEKTPIQRTLSLPDNGTELNLSGPKGGSMPPAIIPAGVKEPDVLPGPMADSSSSRCIPSGSTQESAAADAWPAPIITSLYPPSMIAGGDSFVLTVDGNYFIPETRVLWDARDYTTAYHSPYQMTATIPDFEVSTPGEHYLWVTNPDPCGGDSNISSFIVRDTGLTFPMITSPLSAYLVKGNDSEVSLGVSGLPQGLLRFNITLEKTSGAPFSFFFESFPSWVSDPTVTRVDENRLILTGGDSAGVVKRNTTGVTLAHLSVAGTGVGTGQLRCILNDARTENDTPYGTGYTALPVISRELSGFPIVSGETGPLPQDPDGDGKYEDTNGNHRADFADVVLFFQNLDRVISTQPWWLFDYDTNSAINLNDVVTLFTIVSA